MVSTGRTGDSAGSTTAVSTVDRRTCALLPDRPNALTPATNGAPDSDTAAVGTDKPEPAHRNRGVGSASLIFRGKVPGPTNSIPFNSPRMPAAEITVANVDLCAPVP